MFNVYKNQLSRQTGSRNLTGPKTLPTIWGTDMKLVTKYQISAIDSCWEKCDEKYLGWTDRGKTVPHPLRGAGGWHKSDIWSQASYRYPISWEAFLDPSDSYFRFADFVDFYTHLTYMHIFLSKYWWQESDIWSQASYRYAILWEAFLGPIYAHFSSQLSRQTGSRNLTGQKTLPTIQGTDMKLVAKYQICVINSCWEKCDEKYLRRTEGQTDGQR
jgi:hypothetical protein